MATDNNVKSDQVVSEEEESAQCSEEDIASVFLGRWILVDSEMSAPCVSFDSGEMVVTHQVSEKTGEDEYLTNTSFKIRLCCLPCIRISGGNSAVTRLTGKDTFTVQNTRTNIVDGTLEYGKREGNNKFKTVGKKGTNEIEYRGDKCYMKIVDARYSLYITQEWKRVENFTWKNAQDRQEPG